MKKPIERRLLFWGPVVLLIAAGVVPAGACDRSPETTTTRNADGEEQTAAANGNGIVFWTMEVESSRMDVQNEIAEAFRKRTGIPVKIVPVPQSKMSQKVIANRAAGTLPDVIFTSASSANGWAMSGLFDPTAAKEVVTSFGRDQFKGLHLLEVEDGVSMVPSDGWVNLTLYRHDLFEAHDLPPPTTWDRMLTAANTLHDLPHRFGVLVPTAPNNVYTLTTLEQIALSNDAHLLDERGRVNLNTNNMVEALTFYKKLAEYTPPGNYYWKQTRLYYFVGRTPQIFWSPFILDELAGGRADLQVGVSDLASKTRVRTVLRGPRGAAGYISVSGFGITSSGETGKAKRFVRYMLDQGYTRFFQMDPFGKFPLRQGTADAPEKFVKIWKRAAPQLEKYSPTLIDEIVEGIDHADRWGLKKGRGRLISKLYGTHTLSRILVRDFLRGDLSARETARKMNREARALQSEISASE